MWLTVLILERSLSEMGTKNDPGKYDCYAAAEPDEPMFVLLARDETAPLLVERWANRQEARGASAEKVAEARDLFTVGMLRAARAAIEELEGQCEHDSDSSTPPRTTDSEGNG